MPRSRRRSFRMPVVYTSIVVLIAIVALSMVLKLSSRAGSETPSGGVSSADKNPVSTESGRTFASTAGNRLPADNENRPIVVHENGYVGSQSCQTCHAEQHATWHASFHRTMTQPASAESVQGNFDDVEVTFYGDRIHLWREKDQYWVEMSDLDWKGPKHDRPRISRQIVQVTGSHHKQVYWYETGQSRSLGQFPLVWIKPEGRWVPRNAAFLVPELNTPHSETGRWNTTCIMCHTTGPQPRYLWPTGEFSPEKEPQFDTHVGEFGISCEACHGPGERHVRWHQGDRPQAKAKEASLVVPPKLGADLASQVCAQCHGKHIFKSTQAFYDYSLHGFRFRPGNDLEVDRNLVQVNSSIPKVMRYLEDTSSEGLFWGDGMIRLGGREYSGMIEAPCFKHAKASEQISCMSCHTMHPDSTDRNALAGWANKMLTPEMRTNRACTQCHHKYRDDATLAAHTHHRVNSSGSDCYNCHMPRTSYALLAASRSHKIDTPNVQASLATGRPNACNLCHLDKTLDWAAERLESWYAIPRPKLGEDERTIAASVLWSLKGDAAQRALMAWSMGWSEAQNVSHADWMRPYLTQLMADPYPAIRTIAFRSMRGQKGFENLQFDPNGSVEERRTVIGQIVRSQFTGSAGERIRTTGTHLLLDQDGQINRQNFQYLLRQRSSRPIVLIE